MQLNKTLIRKVNQLKFRKIITFFLICLLHGYTGQCQVHNFPLNHEINNRFEKAVYDQELYFSNIKPFDQKFSKITDSINSLMVIQSGNRLLNDYIFEKIKPKFSIFITPIITIAPSFCTDSINFLNNYRIGLSLKGSFGEKLGFRINGFYGIKFYPSFFGNQIDEVNSLPHFGNYLFDLNGNYHYYQVSGYMSYSPFEFLNFKLGIDNNFWGDGYRSLFLSDNSAAYPFLNTSLNIWKIKYIFQIAALSDIDPIFGGNGISLKLKFSHFLSYNVNSWLNLGFFESIISNPKDSAGVFYINPAYLNPVIFLRPVEFASGSADNAVLGLSFKIKLLKKYQVYSQFLVDEFVLSEMKSNKGWWGNKFGIQSGLKIFDPFHIKNLFIRFEYNQVRPYTYSHDASFLNYGNQFQSMAHPMGANFREFILESHYHYKRYSLQLLAFTGDAGMDTDTVSYGQDIYKPNIYRVSDYGISQGQGLKKRYQDIKLKFSWLLNYKMDLSLYLTAQYQNYFRNPVEYKTLQFTIGISSLLFNDEPDFFR